MDYNRPVFNMGLYGFDRRLQVIRTCRVRTNSYKNDTQF